MPKQYIVARRGYSRSARDQDTWTGAQIKGAPTNKVLQVFDDLAAAKAFARRQTDHAEVSIYEAPGSHDRYRRGADLYEDSMAELNMVHDWEPLIFELRREGRVLERCFSATQAEQRAADHTACRPHAAPIEIVEIRS